MLQAAVYDLAVAPPHVDADVRLDAHDYAVYAAGYTKALRMAFAVMDGAERRYAIYLRTRRLETRRRREKERA